MEDDYILKIEHPPPLSKYILKIYYGGKFVYGKGSWQYYEGGAAISAVNLATKEASLDVLKAVATDLGYENSKIWYRWSSGCIEEITDTQLVTELISHELAADRELKIYFADSDAGPFRGSIKY